MLADSLRPGDAPRDGCWACTIIYTGWPEKVFFKRWLMLLSEIHLRTGKEELRSLVMKHSKSLFETPDWESWRFELTGTGRPSILMGRDR